MLGLTEMVASILWAIMLKSAVDRRGVRYQTAPELTSEYDLHPVPKEKFHAVFPMIKLTLFIRSIFL